MKLRELLEDRTPKVVAIMPGGFHPFHPGHKSLYDYAIQEFGKDNVYVAATNDTTSRPFPFNVKAQLAELAGIPSNRFIQVKSPFNALSYSNLLQDAPNTALVFIRSEKDKSSHPLPDQIRKSDGNMGYLISYDGKLEHGADKHGYILYGPTIDFKFSGASVKSASELRERWPQLSQEEKLAASEAMYPGNGQAASDMLDNALGSTEIKEARKNPVVAKKITPLKMINPPKAPDATIPRTRNGYTTDNGITYTQDKYDENIMQVSTGSGDYTFEGNRLIKWVTPRIKGYRQIHNFVFRTIKIDADIEIMTKDGPVMFSTDAVYDLEGNLKNAGQLGVSSGGLALSVGNDKSNINYVISDNLSMHIEYTSKSRPSDEQIKAAADKAKQVANASSASGQTTQPLVDLALYARKLKASVTFKSPANQGAIPFNQGIKMLKQVGA